MLLGWHHACSAGCNSCGRGRALRRGTGLSRSIARGFARAAGLASCMRRWLQQLSGPGRGYAAGYRVCVGQFNGCLQTLLVWHPACGVGCGSCGACLDRVSLWGRCRMTRAQIRSWTWPCGCVSLFVRRDFVCVRSRVFFRHAGLCAHARSSGCLRHRSIALLLELLNRAATNVSSIDDLGGQCFGVCTHQNKHVSGFL
jgi:hypothetical protein